MKKTIGKSILAAIAVGLVSISYVSADTVAQSVSINHSEAASKSNNVTPNMNNASPIKQIPRMQLVGWPIMTQDSARNFKGIAEVTQKLPYEAEAPSYIPFGYQQIRRCLLSIELRIVRDVRTSQHCLEELHQYQRYPTI